MYLQIVSLAIAWRYTIMSWLNIQLVMTSTYFFGHINFNLRIYLFSTGNEYNMCKKVLHYTYMYDIFIQVYVIHPLRMRDCVLELFFWYCCKYWNSM